MELILIALIIGSLIMAILCLDVKFVGVALILMAVGFIIENPLDTLLIVLALGAFMTPIMFIYSKLK